MKEEVRNIICETALKYIETPYTYGAYLAKEEKNPKGFDCSSFVQFVFRAAGIEIPRSSVLQAGDKSAGEVAYQDESSLLPGDLIFVRGTQGHYNDSLFDGRPVYIGHVLIYIGNGEVIHALGGDVGKVIRERWCDARERKGFQVAMVKRY